MTPFLFRAVYVMDVLGGWLSIAMFTLVLFEIMCVIVDTLTEDPW